MSLLQLCGVLLAAAAYISRFSWFEDLVVAVLATVLAEAIIAIACYLARRVRRVGQSGNHPQFDFKLVRPDGTSVRVRGSDMDAVLKAWFAGLATVAADRRGQ